MGNGVISQGCWTSDDRLRCATIFRARPTTAVVGLGVLLLFSLVALSDAREIRGHLETGELPSYLRDRGEGVPLSMFGTYIQQGQLIIYPFFEYYQDADAEYSPDDLGYGVDMDYRGEYEAAEGLLFLGYGLTADLAIEMEFAIISADLDTDPADDSGVPPEVSESGLGDVEGQLRYRWFRETVGRPELFSYFETVVPTQDEGSLIGTTDWEFKLGTGLTRGFSFGTVAVRGAIEYDKAEDAFDIGEIAIEYVRRLSGSWRVYAGSEGSQDEWELITEAQWHPSSHVFIKMNNALGLTSKATDWAPEVGVVFSL